MVDSSLDFRVVKNCEKKTIKFAWEKVRKSTILNQPPSLVALLGLYIQATHCKLVVVGPYKSNNTEVQSICYIIGHEKAGESGGKSVNSGS